MNKAKLFDNINKLHTTDLGIQRIKRNLGLDKTDTVDYCRSLILKHNTKVERKGKNWYITVDNTVLTINANSYTIITAKKF